MAREKRAKVSEPSPEELAELDASEKEADENDVDVPEDDEADPQVYPSDVKKDVDLSVPDWVRLPADMEFPQRGITWTAMRFRAEWTDRPELGDRQCVVWNLSYGDEKFARRRAKGDADTVMDEQAKQMIRAIDGRRVDWTKPGGISNPDAFWEQIGKKCRLILVNHFMKVHVLDRREQVDFFTNCLVLRTAPPSSKGRTGRERGR